jgi:hypothetical protein
LVGWRAREIKRRLFLPLADEPSIVRAEAVGVIGKVLGKLRNVLIEQVLRIFGWRSRLPGAPKPPSSQLQLPRHEFEQSMFAGARELRSRGLPAGHQRSVASRAVSSGWRRVVPN